MADTVTPASAPTVPSTLVPVNGSTPGGAAFTRVPIAVSAEVPTTPDAAKTDATPVPPKQDESVLVAALAKANAETRSLRKANEAFSTQLSELNTKLSSATEGSAKAIALEAEINDMLTKPNKFFSRFKAKGENKLAEILEGFAAEDAPEDPRIVALEAKQRERDERDLKEKEEREKSELTAREQALLKIDSDINGQIAAIISSDANKDDSEGVARWALVSLDESAPNAARLAVREFAVAQGILDVLTREQRDDLLCQALDQMEHDARTEALAKAERLRLAKQAKLTPDSRSFSLKPQSQYDSRSQKQAPVIDANVRGNLPAPSGTTQYRHGFTKE